MYDEICLLLPKGTGVIHNNSNKTSFQPFCHKALEGLLFWSITLFRIPSLPQTLSPQCLFASSSALALPLLKAWLLGPCSSLAGFSSPSCQPHLLIEELGIDIGQLQGLVTKCSPGPEEALTTPLIGCLGEEPYGPAVTCTFALFSPVPFFPWVCWTSGTMLWGSSQSTGKTAQKGVNTTQGEEVLFALYEAQLLEQLTA